MNKTRLFQVLIVQLTILSIFFLSCTTASKIGEPVNKKLKDGVYEGSYKASPNKASVMVTIRGNHIIDIQIVEHWAWKGKTAELAITKKIIEKQSTDVDAFSGATNSSIVIMNAVQKAIEKAYQN